MKNLWLGIAALSLCAANATAVDCGGLSTSQAWPDFNSDMHDGGIFSRPVGSHVHQLP